MAHENRSNDFVRVFRDRKGEWRWTRRSRNGRIISTSGEGYVDKSHTLTMAQELNPDVKVTVDDD